MQARVTRMQRRVPRTQARVTRDRGRIAQPYGFVVQVPPVHPQSAVPLHVTVHPPPAQSLIVQVCAPWQVS